MVAKYAVTASRPKEIYRYSMHNDLIQFNYEGLHPYHLKEKLRIGDKYDPVSTPSVSSGSKKYKRKIFGLTESRIGNFLLTIVAYESLNNIKQSNNLELYCHNGLHSDLVLKAKDQYNIILYKNKLIFSNTSRRLDDNPFFSYIGIKFETILCKQLSPTDGSHNKLLLKGKYGRWNFKSVVEIDSFKSNNNNKTLETMSQNERYNNYCEIKLCYSDAATPNVLKNLKTKHELLMFLKKNVKSFSQKFRKWIFQSYFGRQNILTVGIRNKNFKVVCNEEFDFEKDILPFAKSEYQETYSKFINSIDTLDEKYQEIYDKVKALQKNEKDVFIMDCTSLNVKLVETNEQNKFENILIPEYLEWVNNKNDILLSNKNIDKKFYTKCKESSINNLAEDMTKMSVSDNSVSL